MDDILFILSFIMLFLGGEFLVKGSVSIALKMKISMLVVGMTVVSFATSSPELFISLKSTFSIIDNSTDITFGNIIGSNIANIGRGKMIYRFTMGIRRNEPEWGKTINNLIKDNQKEINEILREYNIPLLDDLGNPLKK